MRDVVAAWPLPRWWRNLQPSGRFVARFAVCMAMVPVVLTVMDPLLPLAVRLTRVIAVWVSSVVGLAATAAGSDGVGFVAGGSEFTYRVTSACTIVVPGLLLSAAVVAYPASWRRRLVAVGAGLPVLFGFNTVRLVALGWIGLRAPGVFEAAHLVWFQALLIVAVAVCWLVWVRWVDRPAVVRRRQRRRPARRLDVRMRRVAATALVLTSAAAIAAVLRLDRVYGSAVDGVAWLLAGFVSSSSAGGYGPAFHRTADQHRLELASVLAVAGLFFASASSSTPWRRRLVALCRALPIVFAVHVVAVFIAATVLRGRPATSFAALTNSMVSFWIAPLLVWCIWARRSLRLAR